LRQQHSGDDGDLTNVHDKLPEAMRARVVAFWLDFTTRAFGREQ
jgi:hypothetical protein